MSMAAATKKKGSRKMAAEVEEEHRVIWEDPELDLQIVAHLWDEPGTRHAVRFGINHGEGFGMNGHYNVEPGWYLVSDHYPLTEIVIHRLCQTLLIEDEELQQYIGKRLPVEAGD
jgi:hypothetical protein